MIEMRLIEKKNSHGTAQLRHDGDHAGRPGGQHRDDNYLSFFFPPRHAC